MTTFQARRHAFTVVDCFCPESDSSRTVDTEFPTETDYRERNSSELRTYCSTAIKYFAKTSQQYFAETGSSCMCKECMSMLLISSYIYSFR